MRARGGTSTRPSIPSSTPVKATDQVPGQVAPGYRRAIRRWRTAAPAALAALSRMAIAVILAGASFLPGAWAATPAAAGGEGSSTPVLLRMTFQTGQVRRYALDFDLTARAELPGQPPSSFDARLHLETSEAVLGVFPDGSADVRSTIDRWSLTVQGRPQDLPNAADLAVRQRLRPDGSIAETSLESTPDVPGLPMLPGLPALPALPRPPVRPGQPEPAPIPPLATMPLLPGPPRSLGSPGGPAIQGMPPAPGPRPDGPGTLSSSSAPSLPSALGLGQLGGYPQRALRVGESIVDSLRLPLADLPLPVTAEISINRRVTLAGLQPAAGRPAARLLTAVSVPISALLDELDLTISGAVEAQVTQDIDRRTGWPIAADGTVTVVARFAERSSAQAASVNVRLGLSLRERS